MNLQSMLIEIEKNYENRKKADDEFWGKKITRDFPKQIEKWLDLPNNRKFLTSNNFYVKGSHGQTKWAEIPWLAIFDKSICQGASYGFYLVYLFSENQNIYLSFNQGITAYHPKKYISIVSQIFRKEMTKDVERPDNPRISGKNITLFSHKKLDDAKGKIAYKRARYYEEGNIFSIKYDLKNIPNENILETDLINMIKLLEQFKENHKNQIVGKSKEEQKQQQQKFISNICLGTEVVQSVVKKYYEKANNGADQTSTVLKKFKNQKLSLVKIPKNNGIGSIVRKFEAKKTDFDRENKNKKVIGNKGENLVVKYLKDKNNKKALSKKGLTPKRLKNVIHTSKIEGDGTGYDIRSATAFIEVKATINKNAATPFFISENEIEFSEKNSEKYWLFRIYNLNSKNPGCYILHGDIKKICHLEPQDYKAVPIVKK